MRSPIPISTRLSSFRFSLQALRSPVSPLSTEPPKLSTTEEDRGYILTHSSASTARGSPSLCHKEGNVDVTVVDNDDIHALKTSNALQASPVTPWHATFHRHAASTDQESAYLRRTSHLRYARVGLSFLLFASGATVTGLEADIIARYNRSHLSADWYLNLWPTDLNLTPTLLLLSTGVLTTLLALVTIIITLLPSPLPRTKTSNIAFTALALLTTPLSLATLILAGVVSPSAIFGTFISSTLTTLTTTTGPSSTTGLTPNTQTSNPKPDTIQSFTCAIANTAKQFTSSASTLNLPNVETVDEIVPSGFARICGETRASLALMICVLGFAAVGLGVAGLSWGAERKINVLRGEREVLAARDSRKTSVDVVGEEKGVVLDV